MAKDNLNSKFVTHLPLLVKAFVNSEGDVLEMGTGWFSTMVLHWLGEMSGRTIYSYETSQGWYERAKKYETSYHKIIKIDNWDVPELDRKWGLVFIDHAPNSRRHIDVKRFANLADFIVMHDTEPKHDNQYHYSQIWSLFKYCEHFTKYKPWSSMVSNFKDISRL